MNRRSDIENYKPSFYCEISLTHKAHTTTITLAEVLHLVSILFKADDTPASEPSAMHNDWPLANATTPTRGAAEDRALQADDRHNRADRSVRGARPALPGDCAT